MPKRLLDCCASDFRSFTKSDLLESIQKSEGRVIACETIGTVQPLLGNVTNAEFAASMGADILLLNMFDVQHPVINGLPETGMLDVGTQAALGSAMAVPMPTPEPSVSSQSTS